jgi:hypothetical protein
MIFLPLGGSTRVNDMNNNITRETIVAGKPLAEYDRWVEVPGGFSAPHPELYGKAGLYRAVEHGEVVVIGKAAGRPENRLSGRLYDLRRPGDSGRRYRAGRYINTNMDRLRLEVLITGSNSAACKLADELIGPMKALHSPRENVPASIVKLVAFG